MKKWLLILIIACTGCSVSLPSLHHGRESSPPDLSPSEAPLGEMPSSVLRPQRTVSELLLQRLVMCDEPESARQARLADYPSVGQAKPIVSGTVDEARLNALLVASCEPASTPGILNQLMADLTGAGTWPEEYAALFDLLISGQRAYAAVEKVYWELKQEHDKTIQGLSEIETQIEQQNHVSGQ